MWGTGGIVDAVRRRRAWAPDWWDWEQAGPRADLGRRQRLRKRATPMTSPATRSSGLTHHRLVDRVGVPSNPSPACALDERCRLRTTARRARSRARRGASFRGSAFAPLHAAAMVRRLWRVPGRAQSHRHVDAPRGVHRRDVRRSRGRMATDQRDESTTPRRVPPRRLAAQGTTTGIEVAIVDEAMHLASAEAAQRLRQTGAPRSRRSSACPRSFRRTTPRRPQQLGAQNDSTTRTGRPGIGL